MVNKWTYLKLKSFQSPNKILHEKVYQRSKKIGMACNEQNDKVIENAMHENKLRFKIDPSIEKHDSLCWNSSFQQSKQNHLKYRNDKWKLTE